MHSPRNHWPFLVTILSALVGASCWGLWADRPSRHLEECRQNLERICRALECFANDHHGRYPYDSVPTDPETNVDWEALRRRGVRLRPRVRGLDAVVPRYMDALPTCPAAAKDTYSATYLAGEGPDAFLLWCSGGHHAPQAWPSADSIRGVRLSLAELRDSYSTSMYRSPPHRPLPPGEPPLHPDR